MREKDKPTAKLRASQMNFDQFDELFREELAKIPDQFREGVAQFILEEREHRHSKYMRGLYTLGHYMPRGHFGNPVVILYFGSFVRAFPHHLTADLRLEIARTITHELLHHWENRSGIDLLGEEDRQQLAIWKQKTGYRDGSSATGKNYLEAALFIYLVFIFVAVLARWIMLLG
jgi:predicted Zn-dependent protease with MMP-like domain